MFLSWGYGSHPEKHFSVCDIDKVIYYHKFMPMELGCFWDGFVQSRELCYKDGNLTEEETEQLYKALQCDPANWHMSHLSPPILEGPETGHCGPTYANAGCSATSYKLSNGTEVFTPCCRNGKCQHEQCE